MQNKKQTLKQKLDSIYELSGSLETACCRQCGCCRVACPQMKYSEALQITNKIWNTWSKEEKTELLVTCVGYFFSKSLIKPCPLLNGSACKIYDSRPLNCRLYGLWPKDVWERRVEKLAKHLDLERDQIPLNVQCEFVELKNSTKPTEEQIQKMFDALDNLDKQIISGGLKTGQLYRKAEGMVASNWNYRTIHDWILFFFWGEERLAQMTEIAMVANQEQIYDLMSSFKELVSADSFSLPSQVVSKAEIE